MSHPKIGTMATDFTLPDQNGEPVSLKDFRGRKRVILYFYPKAMTPGCTVQACGMRDSEAELEALDTVVLAVGLTRRPVTSVPVARDVRPEGRSAWTTRARLAQSVRSLGWALRHR